jgi:MFS family permease
MTEVIKKSLRESKFTRWIALILISITMFFAYFFIDVVAPLQKMMETGYKWSPDVFGMLGGSEYFLNVFVAFLILSGIILDKMGIRFTLITAGLSMVIGAGIKFYALTEGFQQTGLANWLDSFWVSVPATAKLAFFGFAIFGIGIEMAGITVSKTIVKWFRGKEMALAMGLEMAIARLGVFAVFRLSPIFAENGGPANSVFMGLTFLCIGFITFFIYTFMDKALDNQEKLKNDEPAEEFKIKDIGKIFSNPGFLAIAGLCVLFYSAIFPFQKFATDMLASKLDIDVKTAAGYFSFFPVGAMILTPFIGLFLDIKGKGATLMIYGAVLLVISHLIFALVPADVFNVAIAIGTIVILGTAFSLVPASMWPSLPKIVEDRYLGSAYGAIFWIQNIGLMFVPVIIGWSITASNPGVAEQIALGVEGAKYDYTIPEFIFAGFGGAAIILGFVLKSIDKKKGFGLELPNKKKAEKTT